MDKAEFTTRLTVLYEKRDALFKESQENAERIIKLREEFGKSLLYKLGYIPGAEVKQVLPVDVYVSHNPFQHRDGFYARRGWEKTEPDLIGVISEHTQLNDVFGIGLCLTVFMHKYKKREEGICVSWTPLKTISVDTGQLVGPDKRF